MRYWGILVGGAGVLLFPALINRAPFLFFDTGEYLRLGRALFAGLVDFDHTKLWLTFLGGRSVTYSLMLVATVKAGTVWLPACIQALCGAFIFHSLVVGLGFKRPLIIYFSLIAFVAIFTCGGLFVSFLMPDIFLAYALLIMLTLDLNNKNLPKASIVALWILLVFSITAHSTNAVIAVVALLLAVAVKILMNGRPVALALRSSRWSFAAIGTALLIVFIASLVIRIGAGEPLRKPPYLMARVLADGPGRMFVRHDCQPGQFAICHYRTKPLDNNDAILWSPDPAVSVQYTADHDERARLSDQELSFVLAAIKRYPILELSAAVNNSLKQLFLVETSRLFARTSEVIDQTMKTGLPNSIAIFKRGLDYRHGVDWVLIDRFHRSILILSAVAVFSRIVQRDFRYALRAAIDLGVRADRERVVAAAFIAILLVLLIINAVLCGALSGPSDRYQARLAWLIPTACFLLYARFGWRAQVIRHALTNPKLGGSW